MVSTGNNILDRVASIDKKFLDNLDLTSYPTDPQEFLDYWWEKEANNCQKCILSINRTKVVKPDGKVGARIMIVGEGPGALEASTGIPMVGPLELRGSHCGECTKCLSCYDHKLLKFPTSFGKKNKIIKCDPAYTGKQELKGTFYVRSAGSIIDGILIDKWKFNYPRYNWIEQYNKNNPNNKWSHESPFFITNIALCRSTDITGLKDDKPTSVVKSKCRYHLAMQWAAIQPNIIIAFGRVALGVLMKSEEGAKLIKPGTFVQTKFGPVLFSLHPAYYLREESKETKALGFAKIAKVIEIALNYCGLPT
jgi:uracil-DNA glycosylase